MDDKNRNFRSSYYDKVGFRGVEAKKSIEKLINEKPMVKEKLSKFCMRFTLPFIYRELVWKVLLDVLSLNTETHDYIMSKRTEHYAFMKESLEVMRKIDETTSKSVVHTLMYLMTEDVLLIEQQKQLDIPENKNLIAIASVFQNLVPCEVTSYYLFKNFIIHQKKFNINMKLLKEQLESILKKEDLELYEHMKFINALDVLPVDIWFQRYFADILHHNSLARVFDKIIGGGYKILPYIGSAILIIVRRSVLELDGRDKILQVLEKISEDTSDLIVSKAFDLYDSR